MKYGRAKNQNVVLVEMATSKLGSLFLATTTIEETTTAHHQPATL